MSTSSQKTKREKPSAARQPGRPKDPAKLAAIISAADTWVRQGGYGRMTMEAVAELAGVSKMTVYAYFPDRDALFCAVVNHSAEQFGAVLANPESEEIAQDLEQTLIHFGTKLLEFILMPQIITITHELGVSASRNPGLGAAFYENGPGKTRKTLSLVLQAAGKRKKLAVDDAHQAADDLLNLWIGDLPNQVAFGVHPPLRPSEIKARVKHGVKLFLKAYAP